MLEQIITTFNEHVELSSSCIEPLAAPIHDVVTELCQSMLTQNNIICSGSLQSLTIAKQFCFYMQHQFKHERPALPCVSLCDVELEHLDTVLSSVGKSGDSLLFFQHAHCTLNTMQLISTCNDLGIKPIICGSIASTDNSFKNAPNYISIPSEDPIAVLEMQQLIMHSLCSLIDYQLFDLRG